MELLTITHTDFTMSIECNKFDAIWNKARNNIGEQGLLSSYSWSDGVLSVVRHTEGEDIFIEKEQKTHAVFFDNADYPIWVEFKDYVKDAKFGSLLQGDNERFTYRKHILAGFLNYKNEIGRSEIRLVYKTKEKIKHYWTEIYHKPTDQTHPETDDYGGLMQEVKLFFDLGYLWANTKDYPQWKPESEFARILER